MKKFLKYLVIFALAVSAIQVSINLIFLNLIMKGLPEYRSSVTLYADKKPSKDNDRIAVITCSNGEYNLEFAQIRDSISKPIDFYLFSGSTHFNFIDYLIENKTIDLSRYNKVILYLPYIVYEESSTFQHRWGFYECTASKDYITYLLRKSPQLLLSETWFYNYLDYKKTIKDFTINTGQQKILSFNTKDRTDVVDSLIAVKSSFFLSNQPFNHQRFINKNEPDLINKVKLAEGVKWYVFLPPMPNIKENLQFSFNNTSGVNVINEYKNSIKDSTLFYDQWWHLNYRGRAVETAEFIESLKSDKFR